jgi:hypothetical protein
MSVYKWFLIVLVSLLLNGLVAITRTVDINGTGQYTAIQSAVTASSPGDTVLVYPGRYYENVSISISNLSLISLEYGTNNPTYTESTIIDGSLISRGIKINQNIQNVTIRGFSITNSKSGIVLDQNSTSVITNCYIFGNATAYGGGINLFKCTTVLSGVRIFDNYAYILAGGMYINGYMGTVNVTFDPVNRCSIYNNTAGVGQDIVAHSINNDLSIPLETFTVANPTSYYAAAYRAWGNEFQLLIDVQNAHHQEANSDLYVAPDGNDANDGLSPATALKTIRTAVYRVASDSLNQKTVHVLPGTYSRTANQQVFPIALKSWVKVVGSGIDETQIIGEMDPAYANIPYNPLNMFASFYQTNASLENLSITSENSNNSCAIWGYREEHLQLKNLRMHDLSPDGNAVIHISNALNCLWDNVTIENIVTDDYGFITCQGSMNGVIKNCIFRNAVNTFSSTEVWGDPLIWVSIKGAIRFENCIFDNITVMDDDTDIMSFGFSGTLPHQNSYTFVNSLFSNLQSHNCMIIMGSPGYPEMDIINCTFTGNTSDTYILMVNGNANLTNSVFYNNSQHEIAINSMPNSGELSTLTIDYSLIRNGYNSIQQATGNTINYLDTNINTEPLFAGGDDIHNPLYYSLSEFSPCINTGTPDTAGLGLPPYDLAGNWRIWNNRIDMGCYEFGSEPWVGNDDPVVPELPGVITATNYPNPFNPTTTIAFSLPLAGRTTLEIYNFKGQRIRMLIDGDFPTGKHTAVWDGKTDVGSSISSGIYFYRIASGKHNYTGKMILAK